MFEFVGDLCSFVVPRQSCELVVGDGLQIASVQLPTAFDAATAESVQPTSRRVLHTLEGDASKMRLNDAKCDRRGRLWYSCFLFNSFSYTFGMHA